MNTDLILRRFYVLEIKKNVLDTARSLFTKIKPPLSPLLKNKGKLPIGDREKGSAREKEKQKDRPQDRQTDKDDTKAEIMFCCGIKMTFILNAIINQGSE